MAVSVTFPAVCDTLFRSFLYLGIRLVRIPYSHFASYHLPLSVCYINLCKFWRRQSGCLPFLIIYGDDMQYVVRPHPSGYLIRRHRQVFLGNPAVANELERILTDGREHVAMIVYVNRYVLFLHVICHVVQGDSGEYPYPFVLFHLPYIHNYHDQQLLINFHLIL